MNVHLEPVSTDARAAVVDIFNYYVENSFAAYPESKVPPELFDMLLKMSEGYPTVAARDGDGVLLGFGLLRPHNPIPAFSETAEITYFVKPGYTNQGIGSLMLEFLLQGARNRGLSSILAGISSLNEVSINFHKKNGFIECGRFQRIGRKHGQTFDVVWMQKML